jgi:hypothetical protein
MVRMDSYFCHILMQQNMFGLLLCGVGAEPCKPYEKRIRSMEQQLHCKTRILNHFDSIFATTGISSSIGIIHAMAIGFGIHSVC